MNLNERQIKAVMYVKEKDQITNKEYQGICDIEQNSFIRYVQSGVIGNFQANRYHWDWDCLQKLPRVETSYRTSQRGNDYGR